MKDIIFAGYSLDEIRNFPQEVKREAGYELDKVQKGMEPTNWKSMPSVGSGVTEIRIKDISGIYRVMYVAKFEEAIYVLHAFQKKTQKTTQQDINITKQALKQILEGRKI